MNNGNVTNVLTHATLNKQLAEWTICGNVAQKLTNYMKGSKIWLIVKRCQQHAIKKFKGTAIKITSDGHLHIVVGFVKYRSTYIPEKVS